MTDSAIAKKMARPGASFARCYGLAFVSVTGALLLELLFHHFNMPHPFAAFANEEFRREKAQLVGLFELSPDPAIPIACNWTRSS